MGSKRKRPSAKSQSAKRLKINEQTREELMSVYDKDSGSESSGSDNDDRMSKLEELHKNMAKQLQTLIELQSNREPGQTGLGGGLGTKGLKTAAVGLLLSWCWVFISCFPSAPFALPRMFSRFV